MGYTGKLEEKHLATKLRKCGLSYSEIRRSVPVSKGTLSRWCRDIILSPNQLEKLTNKRLTGAEKGRIIGAKIQQNSRIKRTKILLQQGQKEVGKLSKRERFIAGTALYIGDGNKGDKSIGFSNANPIIIKFMIDWFKEFCNIPHNKYRGHIWIHDNLNEPNARNYWSKITNIPLNQFHKSYIAKNKPNSRKIRKKLHSNGVFAIVISSSEIQRKILGWMAGILGKPLV